MGYARKSLVCLNDTPYYHVIARCVRGAWLWGFDEYAGRDYSHRKAWVLERLEYLSSIFSIDICAYAVMSNHYHAGIAATPEESEFTSIFTRIQALRPSCSATSSSRRIAPDKLLAFHDQAATRAPSIPMSLRDYLELIDWSGRIVRADKRGAIDEHVPPILKRLNIDPSVWQCAMRIKGNVFARALGRLDHLRLHAQSLGQSRVKGLTQAHRLFLT